MQSSQVEALLKQELGLEEIIVKVEGTHYQVIAVGDCFDGLTPGKKQQLVYKPLMEKISDSN